MAMNVQRPFQIGDIVVIRGGTQFYKVEGIPGDLLYDGKGFGSPESGMTLENYGWIPQSEVELVRPTNQLVSGSIGFNPSFSSFPFPARTIGEMSPLIPTTRTKKQKVEEKPKKDLVKPKLTLDKVILDKDKKEEIRSAMSQLKNEDKIFNEWGFGEVFEKGTAITMLFYGVPGTGKTLMAQSIAEENDAELKIYGMAEIGSSEPGGSERTIQKIFKEAREFFFKSKKQRVILFDECDSLLYDRNKVGVILGAQINALLSEIEHHEGIVIFTTNRIGTLDPALERRITAKIEFPFPDKKQREEIWRNMVPSKAPLAKSVNFKRLAEYPLAGGNIKNAVLNAVRMAAYTNGKEITMKNFMDAMEKEAKSIKAFASEYEEPEGGVGIGDYVARDSGKIAVGIQKHLKAKFATKPITAVGGKP